MSFHTVNINSWPELVEIIDELQVHTDSLVWYLRGQADASWQLVPSIVRIFSPCCIDAGTAYEIEQVALGLFQSQAHLYLKPDLIDQNSWACVAWWSLMQHYSCPTRLLDWTRSPYVAAYFAVNQQNEKDGAIWYFPAPALEQEMHKSYGPLDLKSEKAFGPSASAQAVYPVLGFQHTQRSAAQQGVFTVATNILTDHGAAINGVLACRPKREQLARLVIPAAKKLDFLSRLHTMNITAKTLFPGIDGVGRSVSEIVTLRVWRQFKA